MPLTCHPAPRVRDGISHSLNGTDAVVAVIVYKVSLLKDNGTYNGRKWTTVYACALEVDEVLIPSRLHLSKVKFLINGALLFLWDNLIIDGCERLRPLRKKPQ